MLHRFATAWDYLKTSLWFVPAALSIGAVLLASAALRLDLDIARDDAPWWLHNGSAEDAGDLLATLLSSLFTMTTLAISITMVVLTLAANQLGPRLIRSFMGDRRTQLALGLFIGTVAYLLLVLRTIDDALAEDAVPHAAVTLGSGLALLCLFVLLFFVHHLARSIVADTVVERVGRDLDAAMRRALPDRSETAPWHEDREERQGAAFPLAAGGYVQVIDHDKLIACARRAGAVIELPVRAGHHLVPGAARVCVRPAAALTPALQAEIESAILTGPERTPAQDLEFAIRQLVEIALRALSPGVNDPFTAVAVIDRLVLALGRAMPRAMQPRQRRDGEGVVRLIAPASGFAGLVDAAFNQIRQVAGDKPDILIRMLEGLGDLARLTGDPERGAVLLDHARMILEAGRRSVAEPRDLAAIEDRYRAFAAGLGERAPS